MPWPPDGVPLPTDRDDNLDQTTNHPLDHNSANAAINEIVTRIGADPPADIGIYLDNLSNELGTHSHTDPYPLIAVAVSDETTALTTGAAKVTFRMPQAATVTQVRSSLTTASSSGLVTVDINEDGVSILSTKLSIDSGEKSSSSAATAVVMSDTAIAADSEITIDIDAAGTGAKGLKVYLSGIWL